MLIQSRIKHTKKKYSFNNSTQLKIQEFDKTNPQIQFLFKKLKIITDSIPVDTQANLNLIRWERIKYRPTQSQNRIKIQNQISISKASNQKVRSRVKPIKRNTTKLQQNQINYKEHYQFIKPILARKKSYSQPFDSEQQKKQNNQLKTTKLKFYDNLKKYKKVVDYLQQKIQKKQVQVKKRSTISHKFRNDIPGQSYQNKLKRTLGATFINQQKTQNKFHHILSKWKPDKKQQKKFITPSTSPVNRKRMSMVQKRTNQRYLPLQKFTSQILQQRQISQQFNIQQQQKQQ